MLNTRISYLNVILLDNSTVYPLLLPLIVHSKRVAYKEKKAEEESRDECMWHWQTPANTTKKHGEISMTENTSASDINTQSEP